MAAFCLQRVLRKTKVEIVKHSDAAKGFAISSQSLNGGVTYRPAQSVPPSGGPGRYPNAGLCGCVEQKTGISLFKSHLRM